MGIGPYNHTNWYPEDLPKPDVKPSNKYATWIWLGLVVVITWVLVTYTVHRRVGCLVTDCRSNPAAPPLSWDEQFAIGQASVLKTDKDAILESVFAQPIASWPENWTVSDTLKLSFTYRVPSGSEFVLEYGDTTQNAQPQEHSYRFSSTSDPSKELYQFLDSAKKTQDEYLTTVKVSAREAEIATWQEAAEKAKKDGVDIAPVLMLWFGSLGPNEHPRWEISYWPISGELPSIDTTPVTYLMNNYSSHFTVDAVTGDVIGSDMGPGPILLGR